MLKKSGHILRPFGAKTNRVMEKVALALPVIVGLVHLE